MRSEKLARNTILVTGSAGFIGSNLVGKLMKTKEDINIIGIDNMNDYYDGSLKGCRIERLRSWFTKLA